MINSYLSNSSSLKNKSQLKTSDVVNLPPINPSQELNYQNDYQNDEYQSQQNIKSDQVQKDSQDLDSSVSKLSSLISSKVSSIENVQKNNIQQIQNKQSKQNDINAFKSQLPTPQLQNQYSQQYKNLTPQQIQNDIKRIRKQILDMNQKLNLMLNQYNMAKAQFVSKQLVTESKRQFYQIQIETNKKIQEALNNQIKHLSSVQQSIKDKDILIDLQQLTVQLQKQIHHFKKEEHDARLKVHKQDMFLDEIIKTNEFNEETNLVKILKLQTVYYMKKQNNLKIREQQLQHEEKLISQNDKNLQKKVQQMKKNNKNYHLVDENYTKNKKKTQNLTLKISVLKKNLQALKRSNQIKQQKFSRQILNMDEQLKLYINPRILKCEQQNQQVEEKIEKLIEVYQLKGSRMNQINYKFSDQFQGKNSSINNERKVAAMKTILKPNMRPFNMSKNQNYRTIQHQQKISLYTQRRTNLLSPSNHQSPHQAQTSKSNQKLSENRYNDKNLSTIDVPNQQISDNKIMKTKNNYLDSLNISNSKPKNFKLFNRKQKSFSSSQYDKNKSISTTVEIDIGKNNEQNNISKLLKPRLFIGKLSGQGNK